MASNFITYLLYFIDDLCDKICYRLTYSYLSLACDFVSPMKALAWTFAHEPYIG